MTEVKKGTTAGAGLCASREAREAAADLWAAHHQTGDDVSDIEYEIRCCRSDDHLFVQAFHRAIDAATKAERSRCAAIADAQVTLAHDGLDLTGFAGSNRTCRIIAAAIRKDPT